eukprot:TRINITY_DN16630_c1_g1_i1.p1 TRINITY_DN16630_c1_g1~~TRINITY_DN16630_c1_g1_i1.p1  ORF type:complete len:973 (+),score=369.05 TRINITY_DN16630_c1_g1_i1:79-2997(+)
MATAQLAAALDVPEDTLRKSVAELEEGGVKEPLTSAVDSLIAAKALCAGDPATVILRCWQRLRTCPAADAAVKECASGWLVTALTRGGDELIGGERPGAARLMPLLSTGEPEPGVVPALQEVARLVPADELRHAAEPLWRAVAAAADKEAVTGRWGAPLGAARCLGQVPELAAAAVGSSSWLLPEQNGLALQRNSILGPFFGLSCIRNGTSDVFAVSPDNGELVNPSEKQRDDGRNGEAHRLLHTRLHDFVKQAFLSRKPTEWPTLRSGLLDFIARMLNGNEERSKEMPDRSKCSDDFTMYNLLNVLLLLVEPIYDRKNLYPQLRPSYVASRRARLRLEGVTRVAADSDQAQAFQEHDAEKDSEEYSFVCEVFFLCAHAVHLAVAGSIKHHAHCQREVRFLKEAARNPVVALMHGMAADQVKQELSRAARTLHLLESTLMDQAFVERLLTFFEFHHFWLQWIARGREPLSEHDSWRTKVFECIPHDTAPPKEWAVLPQYYVQDVTAIMGWWLQNAQQRVTGLFGKARLTQVMSQCIQLMANDRFVGSPYVRAAFPEMLFYVVQVDRALAQTGHAQFLGWNGMFPQMLDHYLAKRFLIPHAMKTFVDVENLGGSEQFFEKFIFRFYLSVVIKELWQHQDYRESLKSCARGGGASSPSSRSTDGNHLAFIRFFNMMINDATYLLGESVSHIHKINAYEALQGGSSAAEAWLKLSKEEQQQKRSDYEDATRHVKAYLQFANEAVELLHSLSQDIPEAFLRPSLVGRLSAMLNFFLIELTRDAQKLKVRDPAQYAFDHARLVCQIVRCFCSFGAPGVEGREDFLRSVTEDGRSYSVENFDNALRFVSDKSALLKLASQDVYQFAGVVQALREVHSSAAQHEIPEEDIPEEFLDPIMQVLLTDPVQLPNSGEWMQRSVIEQIVLNDSKNPFNREKLEMAQLEEYNRTPAVAREAQERKHRCLEWRAKYVKEKMAVDG